MGVLRDLGEMMLKIGEIIVSKTEEYTHSMRQMLEIKKLDHEIDRTKIRMADHILSRMKKGGKSLSFRDQEMKNFSAEISRLGDEASKIRKSLERTKTANQKKSEN